MNSQPCTRCGKPNLDPDFPHWCTPPLALRLADALDKSVLQVSADAAAELRRLHVENEALVADAERYRWLREYNTVKHPQVTEAFFLGDGNLDAAIDQARSKT